MQFDIEAFNALPKDLCKSDYIDILLFLIHEKPAVRLGKNTDATYKRIANWCDMFGFASIISLAGYMYLSKWWVWAKLVQLVDDSHREHAELLGILLGYPRCCCKKIRKIGEQNIDEYEKALYVGKFTPPYNLIDCSTYVQGFSLISHVPCCNTCCKSLKIAQKALAVITQYRDSSCMQRWGKWIMDDNCF